MALQERTSRGRREGSWARGDAGGVLAVHYAVRYGAVSVPRWRPRGAVIGDARILAHPSVLAEGVGGGHGLGGPLPVELDCA